MFQFKRKNLTAYFAEVPHLLRCARSRHDNGDGFSRFWCCFVWAIKERDLDLTWRTTQRDRLYKDLYKYKKKRKRNRYTSWFIGFFFYYLFFCCTNKNVQHKKVQLHNRPVLRILKNKQFFINYILMYLYEIKFVYAIVPTHILIL